MKTISLISSVFSSIQLILTLPDASASEVTTKFAIYVQDIGMQSIHTMHFRCTIGRSW